MEPVAAMKEAKFSSLAEKVEYKNLTKEQVTKNFKRNR